MQSRVLRSLARAAVLTIGAGGLLATAAEARPSHPVPHSNHNGFMLFQGAINVLLNVNRVQCNVNNKGVGCVDPNGSPVLGGGFWPKGTPDEYVFDGGLQVGAVVQSYPDTTQRFAWSGDTVGVYFMDPRGDQFEGDAVTNVFNSLNANDLANWPTDAYIQDTSLYNSALIGRPTISQQDSWVRYWDGNTSLAGGRSHAMGVLVDQRSLAWNFPSGNEDVLYFLFRFINITAAESSGVYDSLAKDGYNATQIANIGAIADQFRAQAQTAYNVTLPATGFTFHNMYASYFQDIDIGPVLYYYQVGDLVFNQQDGITADFNEPTWEFPPNIFGAPFAAEPGEFAVKLLKSPIPPPVGPLTMWGNSSNGNPFPDPVGTSQMYRYISGHNNTALGDPSCSVPNPVLYRTCGLVTVPGDQRAFTASGPFDLKPGQSSVVVVAMVGAAPVASLPATSNGKYAMPAFTLPPSNSGVVQWRPNIPAPPESLAVFGSFATDGTPYVTLNQRAGGWTSYSDANGDGIIEQSEVQTLPRSLFDKEKVAQSVFDNKFLLPFAPDAPRFFLVAGDGQVTVVWQKSAAEFGGNPYFSVASARTVGSPPTPNPLYDPDYRQFDVEGYRIWRGRTQAEMQVIAQFDYAGMQFTDYTAEVFDPNFPNCAPELGLASAANCGVTFTYPYNGTGNSKSYPILSDFVQIPPGGRVQLANGNVFILQADTAVTGGASGNPKLTGTGVPFAFVDHSVRDGFTYYYAVTAFNLNSLKSGPSSLESPLIAQSTIPRIASGQESAGSLGVTQLVGADGKPLTIGAIPTVDPATGEFSGPEPPADGMTVGFQAFVPQILGSGSATVTIDSIVPGYADPEGAGTAFPATYFLTAKGAGAPVHVQLPIQVDAFSALNSANVAFPMTVASQSQAARFGGDSTYAVYGSAAAQVPGDYRTVSFSRGSINGDPSNSDFNGPRWWAGAANENTPNPNGGLCAPASGGCNSPPNLNLSSGALPNVNLFHIQAYATVPNVPMRDLDGILSSVVRAADFQVHWGANGAIDSVVDVTHHVPVPFSPDIRASWGILNDSSFLAAGAPPSASTGDGNDGVLSWEDIFCVPPAPTILAHCGGGADSAQFMDHARLSPVVDASSSYGHAFANTDATGNGFVFYLNGHFFLMQMASLPAAGTVWNARFYSGSITGSAATKDFTFIPDTRPPAVPGLKLQIQYSGSVLASAPVDSVMAKIHTVPDPYYVTNSLEITANTKVLRFVNLPAKAIIRIYSASGILVNVLAHNDPTGGGEQIWNLRNRNNQFVASGVYFYHVEAANGRTKIGRFTVVNYAQ